MVITPDTFAALSASEIMIHARSLLSDRLSLGRYGTSHQGKRDYFEVLGYPAELGIDDYLNKFHRDPLAGRIVEFPADETWRDTPTVKDGRDKDATEDTPFVQAWSGFAEKMRIYHYCQRVDTLCGVGRFGVLLLGIAGGQSLETEVTRVTSLDQILYLRPYGEPSVEIAEFEDNPQSPRFGLPKIYNLTPTQQPASRQQQTLPGQAVSSRPIRVHWSRCIHVADGLLENEVYGLPRLQRVYNLLDDILKLVGGAAEASWLLMRKGFVLNIDPDTEMTTEAAANIEQEFSEYEHGLRRFMKTRGVTVSDLGSEVVDPTGPFGVIISLIAAATGIPQRILLGSERGELASSQDASHWAGRIASRQINFAEPAILRPLIDRLLAWGALPQPSADRYSIVWEPLFELNDQEKATVAHTWADAIAKLMPAYGMPALTLEEFRGDFTPFAAEMPESAAEPAPPPQATPGRDVLEQVSDTFAPVPLSEANVLSASLVGNHVLNAVNGAGYRGVEAQALVQAAARLIARNG